MHYNNLKLWLFYQILDFIKFKHDTPSGVLVVGRVFFVHPANEVMFPDDYTPDKKILFKQPVIRCFIGDQDVMRMALGHAGIGDADEPCILLHMGNRLGTGISHR